MTHSMHANLAETGTPTSETADVASAGRIEEQGRTDDANSAASAAVAEADKAFTTLRATLAMRGFELHVVGDGEGGAAYLVRRWSVSRTLQSLGAVRAFADRAGVPHG